MFSNEDGTLASVRTAFEILEVLQRRNGLRVTDVAAELGMPKSTAHRYLKSLYVAEYVTKNDGLYQVGLKSLSHGVYARRRHEGCDLIERIVEQLAEETGERVHFMVPEHGKAVCLSQSLGRRAVQLKLSVGDRVPLHTISSGKAILAEWTDERVTRYIERNELTGFTRNTLTDAAALREELTRIRDCGYSQSKQEFTGELNAVGAAVLSPTGSVLGALGLSGPTHRMRGERFATELPELLSGTAREITLNLQYAD